MLVPDTGLGPYQLLAFTGKTMGDTPDTVNLLGGALCLGAVGPLSAAELSADELVEAS